MKTHGCVGFLTENAAEAWEHIGDYEVVERYGDMCGDIVLHTWDDGERFLGKCRRCGGYILIQKSEYHAFDDDIYVDYFPVSGPEEAHELNRRYSGYMIENSFPGRYLMRTNGKLAWRRCENR